MKKQTEHEKSLQIYAEGLVDHAVDAGVDDLAILFDERVDELTFDPEVLQEVHFQIGYITCAAELNELSPEDLLDQLLDGLWEEILNDSTQEPRERAELGGSRCASNKTPRRSPVRALPDRNPH